VTTKLLLAADSLTIQRVIELTLAGEDIDVISVDDGEEAILRIPLERPDIVLADIGMPKRSGYDVAAFIKDHPQLSHVPVLLLAGAFEPVDEARARQVRSAGVLVKPFEPQQVVARVRELIGPSRRPRAIPDAMPQTADAGSPLDRPVVERPVQTAVSPADRPSAEPGLPGPESGGGEANVGSTSLDDYFDRLDAAFATLGTSKSAPLRTRFALRDEAAPAGDIPTLDEVLGPPAGRGGPSSTPLGGGSSPHGLAPEEPSDVRVASLAGNGSDLPSNTAHGLADLFHLLLAVEQGHVAPESINLAAGRRAPEITDELVERVARRVLERLTSGAMRDIVADVVSPIAERLVREEIDRIRHG
jgi:CheY-like chemotaxis protein